MVYCFSNYTIYKFSLWCFFLCDMFPSDCAAVWLDAGVGVLAHTYVTISMHGLQNPDFPILYDLFCNLLEIKTSPTSS